VPRWQVASAASQARPCCALQADPIRLATLTPLTGAGRLVRAGDGQGRRAVTEEVNKAGGVLGRRVVLVSEDDQTSPEGGRRAPPAS